MGDTYSVGWLNEWVVDSDNVNVLVLNGVTEDNATDTTEAVDSNLGNHYAVIRSARSDSYKLNLVSRRSATSQPLKALRGSPNGQNGSFIVDALSLPIEGAKADRAFRAVVRWWGKHKQ